MIGFQFRKTFYLLLYLEPYVATFERFMSRPVQGYAFRPTWRPTSPRNTVRPDGLYPSRPVDAPTYLHVPEQSQTFRKVTFAFAGTVNTGGHAKSLAALASVLKETNGALIVYSNLSGAIEENLTADHVTVRPILPFKELIDSLPSGRRCAFRTYELR